MVEGFKFQVVPWTWSSVSSPTIELQVVVGEVEQFMFIVVELLLISTEQPSMETLQTQEMVMIFTGTSEPSPSTIRALLPTPPTLQSKVR